MNAKPTPGTPAQYVAEYFTENSSDRLVAFRESLVTARERQMFADRFAKTEALTDQTFPRAWFTVDADQLLAYLDAELADLDEMEADPELEPELARVAELAAQAATIGQALREAVQEAVAVGVPISRVAKAANLTRPTVYKWAGKA